jgi:desumoylating isopeptidase 1
MSTLDSLSTDPILFTQVPNLDTVFTKLSSFIDGANSTAPTTAAIKQTLAAEVIPALKARFTSASNAKLGSTFSTTTLTKWAEITRTLSASLPAPQLFPLVDLWRLALLDSTASAFCASSAGGFSDPVQILLAKGLSTLSSQDATVRNFILTLLRLLSNTFATAALARNLLSAVGKRKGVTSILVASLLHSDAAVRTAAASLAFNIAAYVQKERLEQVRNKSGPFTASDDDGDWEVEVVSAVLEALQNEVQSEDIGELVQIWERELY